MMDTLAMFPAEAIPELTADDARAELAKLPDNARSDRAAYLLARASGRRWTCPDDCTDARGNWCVCPCGSRCHGRRACVGH